MFGNQVSQLSWHFPSQILWINYFTPVTVSCIFLRIIMFTYYFILCYLCGCEGCMCHNTSVEVRGQRIGVGSLFLRGRSRDQTWVVTVRAECLYLLSHLASPPKSFILIFMRSFRINKILNKILVTLAGAEAHPCVIYILVLGIEPRASHRLQHAVPQNPAPSPTTIFLRDS